MRGGLDDALDKLARRDELRRRANGEPPGTPQAVTELVEAIAGVVARHPELGVTVGAEGAGEPILLHFFYTDGQVQVTADNPPVTAEVSTPRHADFEVEEEPVEEPPQATAYGYPRDPYYGESDTAERRYGSFDGPPPPDPRYPATDPGEVSRDLGARLRDLGMASRVPAQPPPTAPPPMQPPMAQQPMAHQPTAQQPIAQQPMNGPEDYPPHPFAATPPPPVPPQRSEVPESGQATRRIHTEHPRVPAEPSAAERAAPQQRNGMPAPLAKPIPLKVERPEETEMAARRLAALLRDDPSLLNGAPD